MFILLWMYLGGVIVVLISLVEEAIVRHDNLCKAVTVILLSLVWPITYLANLIFIAIDIIRRNKT